MLTIASDRLILLKISLPANLDRAMGGCTTTLFSGPLPDFIPREPGYKPLILIITKHDLYKKKDHAVNSKIPKFGVKRINSLRFIAALKYKNFQRNVWLPGTCVKLSVNHTFLRKLLYFKTAINR